MTTSIQLLLIVLIITLLIYLFNGRRILSVSFLTSVVFLISAFFYVIDFNWYRHELSHKTLFVIVASIIVIFAGDLIANKLYSMFKKRKRVMVYSKPIILNKYLLGLFAMFILTSGLFYFYEVYSYSLKCGNISGNFFSMAEFVRRDGGYSKSLFVSQTTLLTDCVVYFLIFAFASNVINFRKINIIYLLSAFPYLIHIMANDSRTNVLKFVCVVSITLFVLIKRKNAWTQRGNLKIVIFGIMGLFLFFAVFRFLGNRTGVTAKYDLIHNISKYVSSSLVGLDIFLNDTISISSTNQFFAPHLLIRVYEFLNNLGFSIETMPHHDVFFEFYGSTSNIYTGLKYFILDFGYYGSLIALFIMSLAVSLSIESLRNPRRGFVSIIMCGYLIYPMIMIPIGNVMTDLFSIATIYTLFYLLVIKYAFLMRFEKKQLYERVRA